MEGVSKKMMTWQKIKFSEYKSTLYARKGLPRLHMVEGKISGHTGLCVGIDPGVNFGITIINMDYIQVFHGKLPSSSVRGQHAWDAIEMVKELLFGDIVGTGSACIEGAAYKDKYGQVGLEEVRIGFYLGLRELGLNVRIVPPMTIRKIAFGHGRTVAGELWPLLNHNAADSLGAALCGIGEIT